VKSFIIINHKPVLYCHDDENVNNCVMLFYCVMNDMNVQNAAPNACNFS